MYDDDLLSISKSHVDEIQESVKDMRTMSKELLVLMTRLEDHIDLIDSARETARKKLSKMTLSQAKTAKQDIWSEEDDSDLTSKMFNDYRKISKTLKSLIELNQESMQLFVSFEKEWEKRYPISDKEFGF